MIKRPMFLAYQGWYPLDEKACKNEIINYIDLKLQTSKNSVKSVIAPHAGWRFSGRLAINVIRILAEKNKNPERIFIFGGHLPENSRPILEYFDIAETPLGNIEADKEVLDFLKNKDLVVKNYLADNTIEILLPIIKYFFKDTKIVAIYISPNLKFYELYDEIYKYFGDNSLFIGSTDLTHYGPNYDFVVDTGDMKAVDWVKEINDKNFIKYLLDCNYKESINYALENLSACSSGASALACYFATKSGINSGELIGYYTSYDIMPSKSFVGYAGIVY